MKIKHHSVVTLTYEVKLENGQVVDKAEEEMPHFFIMGMDMKPLEFESRLTGLEPGEEFSFQLSVDEAYGDYQPELVLQLEKELFAAGPEGTLAIGNVLPMQDEMGEVHYGVVVEVTDAIVKMDFNHPLAGHALTLSGKILEVREATESELENQEVQGIGDLEDPEAIEERLKQQFGIPSEGEFPEESQN